MHEWEERTVQGRVTGLLGGKSESELLSPSRCMQMLVLETLILPSRLLVNLETPEIQLTTNKGR
jgi:hypothetical protein